jgi:hypothetical protein
MIFQVVCSRKCFGALRTTMSFWPSLFFPENVKRFISNILNVWTHKLYQGNHDFCWIWIWISGWVSIERQKFNINKINYFIAECFLNLHVISKLLEMTPGLQREHCTLQYKIFTFFNLPGNVPITKLNHNTVDNPEKIPVLKKWQFFNLLYS